MDTQKMNRVELVQFLESVKAGKIQLTSNVWKLESGNYFRFNGDEWAITPNPVFNNADTLVCYGDEIPEGFPGQIMATGSAESYRKALRAIEMLTDEEIELKVKELSTIGKFADSIVALIKKLNDE